MTSEDTLQASVKAMNSGELYDVTIICTTDDHQASYWMDRLSQGVCAGSDDKKDSVYPLVLAVSEDWGGSGAGNGLGTLYAVQKAAALAKSTKEVDLLKELKEGKISAALYHTAGKGTRMAPLPAGENNNKPGVKLPFGFRTKDGKLQKLTVLEAVVKQTGIYASSRKGRVSVYWGDQVFLPSATFQYKPSHHVDILCTLLGEKAPTAEEWTAQGLEKYGVIACIETADGRVDAAQVEKVSHETATEMLGKLGKLRQVGPSLGSFSVSAAILEALIEEYKKELEEKVAKFDTDPHFWMPLTLSEADYVRLMEQKGTDAEISKSHHKRMTKMKASFDLGDLGLFGAVDVGKDASWWDYGQLKLYSKNSLLLLEESPSAKLLREFLGIDSRLVDCTTESVKVDETTYAFDTKVKSGGSISKSVVAGVRAGEVELDGAIVVNCAAKKIKAGPGAILYNIVDESEEGIVADASEVMVAVTDAEGNSITLKSRMDIDGGKAWKEALDMNNGVTFEEVHKKNKMADIGAIQAKKRQKFDAFATSLGF